MKPCPVAVLGAFGRMGRSLLQCIEETPDASLVGAWVRTAQDSPDVACATSDLEEALAGAKVAIDFSRASATDKIVQAACNLQVPLLCGVTALSQKQKEVLDLAAKTIPVLVAANTSLGVHLLQSLVQTAASFLPEDFDVEILEMHHRNKLDAPSGTALALGQAVAQGKKTELSIESSREGRSPERKEPRTKGTVGFAVLRGGDVAGEHSVIFAGTGERLTLSHQISDRKIFARGALFAALWLAKQKPGRYTMRDVLPSLAGKSSAGKSSLAKP